MFFVAGKWYDKYSVSEVDDCAQEEIDDLLKAVPVLNDFFVVLDKIGSGKIRFFYKLAPCVCCCKIMLFFL